MPEDDITLEREAIRINLRWTTEVVEAFNICPYARGARATQRATREVLAQRDDDPGPSLALLARLETAAEAPDVVQVIYPRFAGSPREFERFNTAVRDAHATRAGRSAYVHATFHPDYGCDARTPDALVYWFRRTPDPTIQLVRYAAIESLRGDKPQGTVVMDVESFLRGGAPPPPPISVSERITRDNHAMVERAGTAAIDAIQRTILEDRARSYARFD